MPNEREILKAKKEGDELVLWVLYSDTDPHIEQNFAIIKVDEEIPYGFYDIYFYHEVAPGEFLYDVEVE